MSLLDSIKSVFFRRSIATHVGDQGKGPSSSTAAMQTFKPAAAENYDLYLLRGSAAEDVETAAVHLACAIAMAPDRFDAYRVLAEKWQGSGDFAAAERVLEDALVNVASLVEPQFQLGLLYANKGDQVAARAAFETVLAIEPGCVPALLKLGGLEFAAKRYPEAEAFCRRALASDNVTHEVWHSLGAAVQKQQRFEESAEYYCKALELRPDLSSAWSNLGNALIALGDISAAQDAVARALALHPNDVLAQTNMGLLLADTGQPGAAVQMYQQALLSNPHDVNIHFNLAVAYFLQGDFQQGWEEYETRWRKDLAMPRPYAFPVWDGVTLPVGELLIYGEQGLGDELMFASCIPDVLAKNKRRVVIECDPRLEKLFARSFPQAMVHGRKTLIDRSWLSDFAIETQCAIGSLPRLFRQSAQAFPDHSGYLRADSVRVEYWRKRLDALGPGLKVGLSWRGGSATTRRNLRSVDLAMLAPILAVPNVHFVNLQYGDCENELAEVAEKLQCKIHNFSEAIADYDETAALVCALDLVISVQTSVVHLAGALGQQAWVMLPFSPEWRYLRAGDRMLWYPSVRLFRQQRPKDWAGVIDEVASQLRALANPIAK